MKYLVLGLFFNFTKIKFEKMSCNLIKTKTVPKLMLIYCQWGQQNMSELIANVYMNVPFHKIQWKDLFL